MIYFQHVLLSENNQIIALYQMLYILVENYITQAQFSKSMNFHKQSASSSFTPYVQGKSVQSEDSDFQISQFSRLSLNSHHSIHSGCNRSLRSNSSLYISSIPILIQPSKSSDSFSIGSRNRKNSVQIEWKKSQIGNNAFLNKSLVGKSSLYHHQQLNLHEGYEPLLHKQLSQKSCPVGNDQIQNLYQIQKLSQAYQQGESMQLNIGRQKFRRKLFLKTKNLLRNLSSYLHKYIRYNLRCQKFIIKYYKKKNPQANQQNLQKMYESFIEWTSSLNLTNFQEYQKVWSQKTQFTSLYRQICYKYYREDLFCDVQSSRLTSKQIIQEYIPQFIQGLVNPRFFTHFQNQ